MSAQVLVTVFSLRQCDQIWLDWLCGRHRVAREVAERERFVAVRHDERLRRNIAVWRLSVQCNVGTADAMLFGARGDFFAVQLDRRDRWTMRFFTLFAAVGLAAIYASSIVEAAVGLQQASVSSIFMALFVFLCTLVVAVVASFAAECSVALRDTSMSSLHRLLPLALSERLLEAQNRAPTRTVQLDVNNVPVVAAFTFSDDYPGTVDGIVSAHVLLALAACVHVTLLYTLVANTLMQRLAMSPMLAALLTHIFLYECVPWLAMLRQRPLLLFDVPWRRWMYRMLLAGFFGRVILERDSHWWFPLAVWFEMCEPMFGLADVRWRIFVDDQ